MEATVEEIIKRIEEITKNEQARIDPLDFLMLKHGDWIRIGENRSYVKVVGNGFMFLCMYDTYTYDGILARVLDGSLKDEDFPRAMKTLEFQGELITCDSVKEFTRCAIYTLAGWFTDIRKVGSNNEAKYQTYIDLMKKNK